MHDVARIAGPEGLCVLHADHLHHLIHYGRIIDEVELQADAPEDLAKLVGSGKVHFNLGLDAAQESFVRYCGGGVQVAGEDEEEVERDVDLLTPRQGEEVDPAVKGNHPAVEQLLGADALAPEVIYDEQTVVGLHLSGPGVIVDAGVKLQL